MKLRGVGGGVGLWNSFHGGGKDIFWNHTLHIKFLIKSLNFVWISMCVIECDLESIVQNSTFPNPES